MLCNKEEVNYRSMGDENYELGLFGRGGKPHTV